jgi:hypothetical protein
MTKEARAKHRRARRTVEMVYGRGSIAAQRISFFAA